MINQFEKKSKKEITYKYLNLDNFARWVEIVPSRFNP